MTQDQLKKLLSLEKEARDFGFAWPDLSMIIAQVMDECREIKDSIDNHESQERLHEEIGDLLHAVISLCSYANGEIENILKNVNLKFEKRMKALKKVTHDHGLANLKGKDIGFLIKLWKEAKQYD